MTTFNEARNLEAKLRAYAKQKIISLLERDARERRRPDISLGSLVLTAPAVLPVLPLPPPLPLALPPLQPAD